MGQDDALNGQCSLPDCQGKTNISANIKRRSMRRSRIDRPYPCKMNCCRAEGLMFSGELLPQTRKIGISFHLTCSQFCFYWERDTAISIVTCWTYSPLINLLLRAHAPFSKMEQFCSNACSFPRYCAQCGRH